VLLALLAGAVLGGAMLLGESSQGNPESTEISTFLPTENEYGEIKYDSDWEDIPIGNGQRSFISYEKGSNRNVYEDGGWKRIKNAKSLINIYKDYINIKEDENGNEISILDFNLTDAHVCFKSNYTGVVPMKVYKVEEVFDEEFEEYIFGRVYSINTNITILVKDIKQCIWIKMNILQNRIVFGDEIYEEIYEE